MLKMEGEDRIGAPIIYSAALHAYLSSSANLSIFGASEKQEGRRFSDYPLYPFRMRSVSFRPCLRPAKVPHSLIQIPQPKSSSRWKARA